MSWIRHNAALLLCLLWYAFFLGLGGGRFERADNVDFLTYFFGAKLAWQEAVSPYAYDSLAALAAEAHHRVAPFLYLPPSLLIFYPLTLVDLATAKSLMVLANHSALALLLFWILPQMLRQTGHGDWWRPGLLPAYVLLFFPVQSTFDEGQVNLWVLVLVGGGWLLSRSRANLWAGLPLALATLLKPHLLFLFPALLCTGQYRVLQSAAGWFFAATLLGGCCLPASLWSDWWGIARASGGFLAPPSGLLTMAGPSNHSTYGMLARWLLGSTDLPALIPVARPVFLGVLLVVLATIGGFSVRWFLRVRALGVSAWGLDQLNVLLVTLFLLSPVSWEHHLVLLLPALLCLLSVVTRDPFSKRSLVTMVALACLALRLHETGVIAGTVSGAQAFGILVLRSLKWAAVILVWQQCLSEAWSQQRGQPGNLTL